MPRGLVVEARGAGEARFTVSGTAVLRESWCGLSPGRRLPLEIEVTLRVRRVAGARVTSACFDDSPDMVMPIGQRLGGQRFRSVTFRPPRVRLVDEEGEAFVASNASIPPDDFTISAREDVGRFESPAGEPLSLLDWVAPNRPGEVVVTTRLGGRLAIHVVGPEDIIRAEPEVRIEHVKGGSTALAPGRRYGPDQIAAATRRLNLALSHIDSRYGPLCTAPPADWFEVRSSTPSVCDAVELEFEPTMLRGPNADDLRRGFESAAGRITADGRCSLELAAPRFATGADYPMRWSAEFVDTDAFFGGS
jgi:hypothetical protein